jgi:hypothetical protein
MLRKALAYGAGLIAVYLVAVKATNAGSLVSTGAKGAATVVKAFQGRT